MGVWNPEFFGKISEILYSSYFWILDFRMCFLKSENIVFSWRILCILSVKDFSIWMIDWKLFCIFIMFCLVAFHFKTCFLLKFLFFPFNENMEMFCYKIYFCVCFRHVWLLTMSQFLVCSKWSGNHCGWFLGMEKMIILRVFWGWG